MPAGKLNKRVIFQSEQQVSDGGGGYELGWADTLEVWGQYNPEKGREKVEQGRLEDALAGTLRVRHTSETEAITAGQRVLIDGEPFQIRSAANEDQRRMFMTFTVEKGVAT